MKDHFNEKYLESEKYPNAIFKGKIEGIKTEVNEEQAVTARGSLTIHGITKEVTIPGMLFREGSKYVAKSKFLIKLEEYKIKIPQLMWQNIAEEVEVTVEFIYKPI
jgi:polyisoprenoid-binding protein YceI